MRTIEEVRKHLSEVVYNDIEVRAFIAGFVRGQGLCENWDKPLDFAEYEERDFTDFFAWWDKAEEEEKVKKSSCDFESWVETFIKDEENMDFSRFIIEYDPEYIEKRMKEMNNKAKNERDKALKKLDETEQYFENEIEKMTNPDMRTLAKGFLDFAKELKEEIKKDTSV